MKTFKMISLLLAALILFTACTPAPATNTGSGDTPAPTTSTTQPSTSVTPPPPTSTVTGGEPELTAWSGEISVAPYMFAPWDRSTDVVVGKIEEILRDKYDINVTFNTVYVEYPEYQNIMNTRIAGGEAPDIWLGQNQSGIRNYQNQGVIANWTPEFFEKYAPNVAAYINKGGSRGTLNTERWWQGSVITTGNGMMNTFPGFYGIEYAQKGVIYRADWLEKLGVTNPPYELDEFIALMRRFRDEDPDGNGKNDTYGFSTSMIKTIFAAYGIYTGFYNSNNSQYYLRDGVIKNADILPEAKAALEFLAGLYAEGLIDPEFITGENTQGGYWAISHGFINGRYGVSSHASFDHFRKPGVNGPSDAGGPVAVEYYAVNGADSDFIYGPWIKGPGGYGYYFDNDFGLGESYVYNIELEKTPEKLATIFRIMDIFATDYDLMLLGAYGVEGEHFEFNAVGQAVSILPEGVQGNTLGIGCLRGLWGPSNTFNGEQNEISYYKALNVKRILEIQSQPYFDTYLRNDIKGTPASTGDYMPDLVTLRDETFIKIIRGEEPISFFDTFVQQYLSMGGQVLQDEANAMYKEQNS